MSKERTIDVGKKVRYDRIVNPRTGKTVMIPLDHGVILGPVSGIEDPRETVRQVVKGGADAVIFNAGMAGNLYPEYGNRCGSILNLSNIITGENDLTLIGSVEYALKQAADAVSVQVMVGSPHERRMLDNFRQVAAECQRWSLPLLAMMYPTEELLQQRGRRGRVAGRPRRGRAGRRHRQDLLYGRPPDFREAGGVLSGAGGGGRRPQEGDHPGPAGDGRGGHGLRRRRRGSGAQRVAEFRPGPHHPRPGGHHPSGEEAGRTGRVKRYS